MFRRYVSPLSSLTLTRTGMRFCMLKVWPRLGTSVTCGELVRYAQGMIKRSKVVRYLEYKRTRRTSIAGEICGQFHAIRVIRPIRVWWQLTFVKFDVLGDIRSWLSPRGRGGGGDDLRFPPTGSRGTRAIARLGWVCACHVDL